MKIRKIINDELYNNTKEDFIDENNIINNNFEESRKINIIKIDLNYGKKSEEKINMNYSIYEEWIVCKSFWKRK